jgi:hypothetical protein
MRLDSKGQSPSYHQHTLESVQEPHPEHMRSAMVTPELSAVQAESYPLARIEVMSTIWLLQRLEQRHELARATVLP